MTARALRRAFVAGAVAALLASCAHESGTPAAAPAAASAPAAAQASTAALADTYAQLRQAGGQVFTLDPAASTVRIYAFRGGRAGRLGHNHVLAAPRFQGMLYVPADGLADARFDLVFRLDQLEFDDPAWRAGLGPAFASVLSQEAIAGTKEHMLGKDNMQAAEFPQVVIHGVHIEGEAPRLAALVAITMHGVTREQEIALHVEGLPAHPAVSGSFVLKQTDYGIRPYSVAGGLLAVKDEVVVDFALATR